MRESLSTDILTSWHEYRHIVLVVFILVVLTLCSWRWQTNRNQRLSTSLVLLSKRESVGHNAPSRFPGSEKPIVASQVLRQSPKRVTGTRPSKIFERQCEEPLTIQPLIFFSSLTGTTEKYVSKLVGFVRESRKTKANILDPQIEDLSAIDYDDFFVTPPKTTSTEKIQYFYLFLIPSYNIDTVFNNFLAHLKETHHDFRIDTAPLSSLAGYSVFGFGDREGWPTEQEGFCRQATELDRWMAKLTSRKRAFPLGMGDVKSDANNRLVEWGEGLSKVLEDIAEQGGLGDGVVGSGDAVESGDEDLDEGASSSAKKRRKEADQPVLHDLEDLGGQSQLRVDKWNLPIDFTTTNQPLNFNAPLDMVPKSSPTYAALTKQGYSIIGSHSGVKICRWTKSALRGRGSCYKYSFYGIKSHLCMETTPSLSCSNKCVFCWRHGTNPVGTTWRWKVDPPDLIFDGAKEAHLKKIRMMKGVPGVRAERFQEAMRIRHCALSLVGEPIFYPHINEFLRLLHAEKISSFLVCNAQHPEQLDALNVVTQLYVSIDASNKESLKKVDRPLHRNFWERFLRCLDILRDKRFRMRTVYRLTLVKGFNIENEVEGYADLVERGLPCFVEIKGVTYCGTSSSAGAGLTMTNVPFYEEVIAFVKALESALRRRGLEYGIAAEHAHSCCVLIASTRFLIGGVWHTLIDYDKFFECLESGKEFSPEDYVGPATPQWATFGHGGFDPSDERVHRKGKKRLENAS
ncbi:MAG: hypothetical protein LQ342_000983 [Letrouitia transgressa]|nr:MAG: hypothetical protein LQ342_000983 [Letrouitia transgressa]